MRHSAAAITGTSGNGTAWMNRLPMPGQANIVSVTTENAIRLPSCRPEIVSTGTSALRSARPKSTTRSGSPRARADST